MDPLLQQRDRLGNLYFQDKIKVRNVRPLILQPHASGDCGEPQDALTAINQGTEVGRVVGSAFILTSLRIRNIKNC